MHCTLNRIEKVNRSKRLHGHFFAVGSDYKMNITPPFNLIQFSFRSSSVESIKVFTWTFFNPIWLQTAYWGACKVVSERNVPVSYRTLIWHTYTSIEYMIINYSAVCLLCVRLLLMDNDSHTSECLSAFELGYMLCTQWWRGSIHCCSRSFVTKFDAHWKRDVIVDVLSIILDASISGFFWAVNIKLGTIIGQNCDEQLWLM